MSWISRRGDAVDFDPVAEEAKRLARAGAVFRAIGHLQAGLVALDPEREIVASFSVKPSESKNSSVLALRYACTTV